MHRLTCAWCLLAACAPQVSEPARGVAGTPTRTTTSAAVCPQPGQPQALLLAAAVDLGEHAGKRWLVARADDGGALLLHLGRAGELLRTPLPRWTEHVSAETPERLRLLAADEPPVWWTVDLRDPDAPQVATPTPVKLPPGHLKGFASDGARALVAMYSRAGDGWQGETSLLRVPDGQRVGVAAPATTWIAACARGRCYGWASANAGGGRVLLALDDTGPRTLSELGPGDCTGAASWHDGERWIVAWSEGVGVGLSAVDLVDGTVRGGVITTTKACPELAHLVIAGRHGLVVGPVADQRWTPIDADLSAGPPEPLPPAQHRQRLLASGEPGVLVAEWTTTRTRVDNGVDPGGHHEWQDETWFRGDHGLLMPGANPWSYKNHGPLPGDGEVAPFGAGPDLLFLTRPGHAGLLVLGSGDEASYLRLYGTCP